MSARVFIVDTNVLVAGLITAERQSPTAQILDAMLTGKIFYLLSSELAQEYRDVLLRPRLTRLHGLNETEIDQVMNEIAANAIWRDPPSGHHSYGSRPAGCSPVVSFSIRSGSCSDNR